MCRTVTGQAASKQCNGHLLMQLGKASSYYRAISLARRETQLSGQKATCVRGSDD